MKERVQFISDWETGDLSMAALCREYGVSRQTGYKWVKRYQEMECDIDALRDHSRAPIAHPWATSHELVDLVIRARKQRPTWGPRKLREALMHEYPSLELPAASTIGSILKRHGLTKARHRRRRTPPSQDLLEPRGAHPNSVWCTDFKGQFSTGDGTVCYPLTLMDERTRFLLRCEGLYDTSVGSSKTVFESVFAEYGLPEVIRSDNGVPFACTGPGGLTELSAWWTKLGIRHSRIDPGKPQQNGRHERMHRTLKDETASPPRKSMRAQQRAFDLFRKVYNDERPHEALDGARPADLYVSSQRMYRHVGRMEYPFESEVVFVGATGKARWCGALITIGRVFANDYVRFELTEQGMWEVYYGPTCLGLYDPQKVDGSSCRCDAAGEVDSNNLGFGLEAGTPCLSPSTSISGQTKTEVDGERQGETGHG
jgi:transposase InsO family protein